MHVVVLGVMKTFLKDAYLNKKFKKLGFYIGDKISLINDKMRLIVPPSSLARIPRDINELNNWKSTEIEIFSLYYGPIVFKDILKAHYYSHFCIFCSAIHKLTKSSINENNLTIACVQLDKFCDGTYEYIPDKLWRYNVHSLQHLVNTVRNFGPLHGYSAYFYESDLAKLKKVIKNYSNIGQLLTNKFAIQKMQ